MAQLLPTPASWDGDRGPDLARANLPNSGGMDLVTTVERLLPTPDASVSNDGEDPDQWQRRYEYHATKADGATRAGTPLAIAVRLLPAPTAQHDARNATANRSPDAKPAAIGWTLDDIRYADRFGEYTHVIDRHAQLVGRPTPHPTTDGRLSPAFVEWMMGLPAGHVTDTPISRTAQLRALGNGVVPQQALAALEQLDPRED